VTRPSLLQICLSIEPSFPLTMPAWELPCAAAWRRMLRCPSGDVPLPNKEALAPLTLSDTPLVSEVPAGSEICPRVCAGVIWRPVTRRIRRHDPISRLGLTGRSAPASGFCGMRGAKRRCSLGKLSGHDAVRARQCRQRRARHARDARAFSWTARIRLDAPGRPDEQRVSRWERMLGRGRASA